MHIRSPQAYTLTGRREDLLGSRGLQGYPLVLESYSHQVRRLSPFSVHENPSGPLRVSLVYPENRVDPLVLVEIPCDLGERIIPQGTHKGSDDTRSRGGRCLIGSFLA